MSNREGQQPQSRATSAMEDSAHEPEPGRPLPSPQEMRVDAASDGRAKAWVIAVALLGVVAIVSPWLLPRGVEIAALCVVAIMLLLVVVRPQWALFIFILGLPLHNLLMALLFHLTGSESFVKLVQPWKEVVVAVALARAVLPIVYRALRRQPRMTAWLRVTPLDLLVMLMVALAGASVLLPTHLVTFVGRLYGFRDLAMPFAVFAIGRLAPLSRRDVRIVVGLITLDSVAFAVGAIGERALWGNGLLFAVGYGTYIHRFLGATSTLPYNIPFTFYTDGFFPRAGSLAVGPLDVGILFMIALPVLLIARGSGSPLAKRWTTAALGLAVLLGSAALVLAWGRESLALVALELVLVLVLTRPRWQWKGVALALAGAALGGALLLSVVSFVVRAPDELGRFHLANTGLVPLILEAHDGQLNIRPTSATSQPTPQPTLATSNPTPRPTSATGQPTAGPTPTPGNGVGELFTQSTSGSNTSTVSHLRSLVKLASAIVHHPQGYGIGTAGQVGNRFSTTALGGETAYLSVGVELGLVGMLVYLAAFAGAVFVCWRAAYARLSRLHRSLFLGVAIAWLIIALDGVFTEVTLNTFAMYFLWWMAGAAITVLQQREPSGMTVTRQVEAFTHALATTYAAVTARWQRPRT